MNQRTLIDQRERVLSQIDERIGFQLELEQRRADLAERRESREASGRCLSIEIGDGEVEFGGWVHPFPIDEPRQRSDEERRPGEPEEAEDFWNDPDVLRLMPVQVGLKQGTRKVPQDDDQGWLAFLEVLRQEDLALGERIVTTGRIAQLHGLSYRQRSALWLGHLRQLDDNRAAYLVRYQRVLQQQKLEYRDG